MLIRKLNYSIKKQFIEMRISRKFFDVNKISKDLHFQLFFLTIIFNID